MASGGEKGDKPIVMNRGGKPYNAFLEGRIDGESYLLVLQLSNMELKRPKVADEAASDVSTVETRDEHVVDLSEAAAASVAAKTSGAKKK